MIKQLMKPVLTGKGPDFSKLTSKECGLGDYRLRYKLPGNALSNERPNRSKPERVNLRDSLFDSYNVEHDYNRTFVKMDFELWNYKGNYFQGYFGKLGEMSIDIAVNRAEAHTVIRESDLDSLESYLKKDYWEYYETEQNKDGKPGANWEARYEFEHPDELIAKGYIPPQRLVLVQLPEVYEKVCFNDVNWLHYAIRGEGIPGPRYSYYWAYPLSNEYYLTICFRMSSEVGNETMRFQRMLEDAKRIMSTVEVSKC
ncbi:hypothetical protein BTA51_19195 [Hahella sp. CCB-MM4]|uniref:hypothetical protein n=1 Tax=Hahella sp. (strain CCB-MM4) TaxID=1926491 RepID=UPI000B9BCE90|nr:hypothetical protein [Hahella sp. CCB-MM4]OZG71764.1 hypothetical protein BTA51_19195 [Hahella sp. CCB-MM4]